jgi:hypothetical protein
VVIIISIDRPCFFALLMSGLMHGAMDFAEDSVTVLSVDSGHLSR